jgi:hypothetical protein
VVLHDISGTLSEEEAKPLREAQEMVKKKDFAGAHKRVQDIPENSRAREEEAFKDIEMAWANWMFQRVEQSTDNAEKKKLLKEIAGTSTVDAEARKRAAEKVREIEASEPAPTVQPPVYNGEPRPQGTFNPGGADPAPAATQTSKVITPNAPAGPPDEEALRRQLEPKVYGGRASVDEIRMLKAICSHLGNRQCRDRAAAMLKKKLENQ